ncbi:MAG: hypothetical protein U0T81_14810 [Saprospiraceae bacterium]
MIGAIASAGGAAETFFLLELLFLGAAFLAVAFLAVAFLGAAF